MAHIPTILIVLVALPAALRIVWVTLRDIPECVCGRPECGGGCWGNSKD